MWTGQKQAEHSSLEDTVSTEFEAASCAAAHWRAQNKWCFNILHKEEKNAQVESHLFLVPVSVVPVADITVESKVDGMSVSTFWGHSFMEMWICGCGSKFAQIKKFQYLGWIGASSVRNEDI